MSLDISPFLIIFLPFLFLVILHNLVQNFITLIRFQVTFLVRPVIHSSAEIDHECSQLKIVSNIASEKSPTDIPRSTIWEVKFIPTQHKIRSISSGI